MLIWLPPSEGKNAPAVGSALSLESLSHPGLTADRRKVADALIELGAGSQAASTLKVGDRIDLSVNETLMSAPCAPASSVFTHTPRALPAPASSLFAAGCALPRRAVRARPTR